MIINNCSDCTIYQYIQCQFKNNYKILNSLAKDEVRTTDAELQDAWLSIMIEFYELCGQKNEDIEDRKQIRELQRRVTAMEKSIWIQEVHLATVDLPMIEAFEDFEVYGYKLSWSNNIAAFQKQLKRIKSLEKTHIINLEDLTTLYERKKEQKKIAKGGEAANEIQTESDFYEMLADCNKFEGYRLNPKEVYLIELAAIRKRMEKAAATTSSN